MFDNRVVASLKNVIGWSDHYDTTEIPALPIALTTSESGQTYQSVYPSLMRLDYIQAMLPTNDSLAGYLDRVETDAINTVLNKVVQEKKLANNGKDIIKNTIIYQNRIRGNNITNQGRFVGIEIDLNDTFSIEVVLNRIGLYLNDSDNDITFYLFNSMVETAIATYTITTLEPNTFTWFTEEAIKIKSNLADSTDGGVWYIGYYQDSLGAQAVQLNTFNWKNGYCGGCTGKGIAEGYRTVSKYVTLSPFYIASNDLPSQGSMFDPNDIVYTYDNNYGININISVKCDITQYLIDNRLSFVNAIGKQVALNVLHKLTASSQVSAIEQNIQPLALRALEGATETKQRPYSEIVDRAIKATNLDMGNTNESPCFPCARKGVNVRHG